MSFLDKHWIILNCHNFIFQSINKILYLIIKSMDETIASKTVTYDFARLMDNANEVKCSEFGAALIAALNRNK